MLRKAAEKYNIDLAESWMIGDSQRDVVAGMAAGCQTVLLQKQLRLLDAVEDIKL